MPGASVRPCMPLWPTVVAVSGVIRREHRPGPPGYGETPDQDEQLTGFVMALDSAMDVCADPSTEFPHDAESEVASVEIVGHVDAATLEGFLGKHMVAFGTLDYRTMARDFTEVIFSVDSIPGVAPSVARES